MLPEDQAPPPIKVVVILSSLGAVFGVAMAEVWSLWEMKRRGGNGCKRGGEGEKNVQ